MSDYFQPTYVDNRDRFLALAREHGAELHAHPITAKGPRGEDLAIDSAYFGPPDPARVLLLISGTHGVEGFAGSACQQQFLAEDFSRLALPADGALLLVHALNPYGFAWLRRTNESNVDLNRNFLDHGANPIRRPDYLAIDPLLNPAELTEEGEATFFEEAMRLVDEKGYAWVQRVFTEGQYERPEGVYYGGNKPEESNPIIRRLCRERASSAREALMIDFHTGLGEWGEYTVLSDHDEDTPAHRWLAAHFPPERVECPRAGGSVSAALDGELGQALEREVPAVAWRSAACEFGTYPGERVMMALRHENWLHHHGDRDSGRGREIVAELLEVFRPDSADWRERVLRGGRDCIEHAWRGVFG